ncbi:MAG: hypothetical protein WD045_12060 [Pirellulaceae bacterium]
MGKKPPIPTPTDATWFDHHQLNFWLWASLKDAATYLESSHAHSVAMDKHFSDGLESMSKFKNEVDCCRQQMTLDAYHFVVTMGNTLRMLERAQHLFPSIQPAYSNAKHLLREGKQLRNMIEHTEGLDGYRAGGGHLKDQFVRENAPITGCSADATSTVINNDGHWLGGRLCVEFAVNEFKTIQREAEKVPPPATNLP